MSEILKSPKCRVSFPDVFVAKSYMNNPPEFAITMLFNKEELKANLAEAAKFQAIKDAINEAAIEKWGKIPPNFQSPIHKGEEKLQYDGYGEGIVFMKASSKFQPSVVNQAVQPIIDQTEFYGGCYAFVTISTFAWEYGGKKGVKLNLEGVQKVADGEPFGRGARDASEDFEAIETTASAGAVDDDLFAE